MLARKLFGKKATVEEPRRPAGPPQGQIFDESLFEGEIGDFLRQNGYAPDDPRNQAVNVQPVSVLLAEDQWAMRKATEAVNSISDFPIVPVHLLPPSLVGWGIRRLAAPASRSVALPAVEHDFPARRRARRRVARPAGRAARRE